MGRIAESELGEAYEVLGEEAVNKVIAKELGYLTSEPLDEVLDAVSNGYDVYLDYDYDKDDVEALLATADEVMSDRRRPCGTAGPEATKDEIFLEFEDGLFDYLKVTTESNALQAAEAISDRLAELCERAGRPEAGKDIFPPDLADGLIRALSLGVNIPTAEVAEDERARFDMTLCLERDGEWETHGSLMQWWDDNCDAIRRGGDVPDWERPTDAAGVPIACALDDLCESQGTTLEKAMNNPEGRFERTLRREILESQYASAPTLALTASVTLDEMVRCYCASAANYSGSEQTCAMPTFYPTSDGPTVGIFDPHGGSGALMGIELERPFTPDARTVLVALSESAMQGVEQRFEKTKSGAGTSYWSCVDTFGLFGHDVFTRCCEEPAAPRNRTRR